MKKDKKSIRFGVIVFILAALLRLGPVLAARQMTIGLDDMFQYDMLARSLAAGEGFRWYGQEDLELVERYIDLEFVIKDYDPRGVLTSFRPPGYPFFLSLIYRLFGLENRFFTARLIQAFVMALIAPLTWLLARRLFPENEKTPKLAGIVTAVYPYLLIYPLALATEVIFIPLVLGCLLAVFKAGERGRWHDFALAGSLLGAAALTRSVILAVLPFILLWLWFFTKRRRGSLIVLAGVLLFIVPWSARNTRLYGEFTSIENNMGYTLYMGYHPETGGRFQYPQSVDLMPYLDDAERNRIGMEKAWGFIQADPGSVPALMAAKLSDFFGLERKALTYFYSNNFLGYLPPPVLIPAFLIFLLPFVLVMLSVAPALLAIRWTPPRMLIGAILAVYIAPHLLLLAEPRFHLTIVPLLAIFAAATWSEWGTVWERLSAPGQRWRLIVVVLVSGLLLFNWGHELWQDAETLRLLFGPEGNKLYLDY